jgi:hypothetical protein
MGVAARCFQWHPPTQEQYVKIRTLISLVVVALVIAACGPADSGAEENTTTTAAGAAASTTEVVEETTTTDEVTTTTEQVAGTEDLDEFLASLSDATPMSARVEGLIEMTGLQVEGGPSDVSIPFAAAFDANSGDNSFSIDMSTLAATMPADPNDPFADMADLLGTMEIRQIGDTVYMKFLFFTTFMGADTDWISMPAEGSDEFTSGFNMAPGDPREIVEAYEGAPATVENLGQEEVNGVDTTHFRITYDLEQLEMTAEERAELEASGLFADGVLPMDLWISDEGYMVRMILTVDGSTADLPPEESFESMTMRYDLFEINQPITIEPPPADDVTDVEGLDFGFGFTPPEG